MKKLIILPGMILACVFLTGCFGLVVSHPRDKCMTQFCMGARGELRNGPALFTPLTQTNVLACWGAPDTTYTNADAVVIWHYVGGRAWTVIMPAYLIGLPIPIPAGHGHTDFYFKDGIAQKADSTATVLTGAMIGMAPPLALAWEKEPIPNHGEAVVGYGMAKESTIKK